MCEDGDDAPQLWAAPSGSSPDKKGLWLPWPCLLSLSRSALLLWLILELGSITDQGLVAGTSQGCGPRLGLLRHLTLWTKCQVGS